MTVPNWHREWRLTIFPNLLYPYITRKRKSSRAKYGIRGTRGTKELSAMYLCNHHMASQATYIYHRSLDSGFAKLLIRPLNTVQGWYKSRLNFATSWISSFLYHTVYLNILAIFRVQFSCISHFLSFQNEYKVN